MSLNRLIVTFIFCSSVVCWSVSPSAVQAQEYGDVLTLGDSLTAGLAGNSRGVITCAALGGRVIAADQQRTCRGDGREGVGGWQPILKQLTQSRIYNYGSSSERTGEMVSRFAGHLRARDSEFVLILAGTNDMIRGGSVADATNNIARLIQSTLDSGRIPVVATTPPLIGGRFNSRNPRIIQLNTQIRALPNRFKGLAIADIYAAVVGNWPSLSSGDTIHFGSRANAIVAQVWFQAMQEARAPARVNISPIIQFLMDQDDEPQNKENDQPR